MKALTQKILESGLVDTHVAKMMERWGQLDTDASDLVGRQQVTKQTMTEFADDLESLMEKKQLEFRETRLDFDAKPTTVRLGSYSRINAYQDSMGRILIPATENWRGLRSGVDLFVEGEDGSWVKYLVLEIETLFRDEDLVAMQVTID